jgi:hypothetical protein
VVSFSESKIVGSVDDKIGGVNVVSFEGSFEQFRMMNCSFFFEVQFLVLSYSSSYVSIDTKIFEIFGLDCKIVFKLTLFAEELGIVSIIEVQFIFS